VQKLTIGTAAVVLCCTLAATTGLGGCSIWTDGKPIAVPANPTEPTFPTRSEMPTPPPSSQPLDPNAQGYVFIETKSGKTRCQISRTAVGCEAQFANPPVNDGVPANGVNVTADGNVRWLVGNLGDIPAVTLDYRAYDAAGWTIAAAESGTRFTNDRTGHGMFVSIERVESF
jgi:hypothetical protein